MYKNRAKRIVLGEGETIGHKHVLSSKSPIGFDISSGDDSIKFMLHEVGIFTHDEHEHMVFEPDKYRSYHQVEFNPMDGTTNNVFD
jgi:hypothetical protein